METILEPADDFQRSYFTESARENLLCLSPGTNIENTEEPQKVIAKFKEYLALKKKWDSLKYFELLLKDADAPEIEKIMGLTRETRDYAQQKLKYQILIFSKQHYWKLVHEWLGASLEENLGLTPKQWHSFLEGLPKLECEVLEFKKTGTDNKEIARAIALPPSKIPMLWRNVLESASAYRNGKVAVSDCCYTYKK